MTPGGPVQRAVSGIQEPEHVESQVDALLLTWAEQRYGLLIVLIHRLCSIPTLCYRHLYPQIYPLLCPHISHPRCPLLILPKCLLSDQHTCQRQSHPRLRASLMQRIISLHSLQLRHVLSIHLVIPRQFPVPTHSQCPQRCQVWRRQCVLASSHH